MKITIDTDRILSRYSDREVFFLCVMLIMFGYIISHYLDSRRFFYMDQRMGSVEVTLEKIEDQLNTDIIERSKEEKDRDIIYSLPRTKYPQIFNTRKKVNLSSKEMDCLSRNIYWESMHEPLIGQLAVAQITAQRVSSPRWGKTFCSVVFAPRQFSWTNFDHIRNARPRNEKQWIRAQHTAFLFTRGVRVTNLDDSHYYFGDYITPPKWSKDMTRTAKIGKHLFYSEKGRKDLDLVADGR